MPTAMSAETAWELFTRGRDAWVQREDENTVETARYDLSNYIDERTTSEWRRTYVKGLLAAALMAPFASQEYHFTHLALRNELEEIHSEPSADSVVAHRRLMRGVI